MFKWLPWLILLLAITALQAPVIGKVFVFNRDTPPPVDTLLTPTLDSFSIAKALDSAGVMASFADSLGETPPAANAKTLAKAQFGTASFYSKKFEGRKTTSGEIFRHARLTAASNHFPLNTWVKVTHQKTGKSVVVKINDRMHPSMKKKGRIVDLTRSAASQLGILEAGLAKVKVEVVQKPKTKSKKRKR
ncbi:MAG: septal ring lytic transglycosylase RlpA family protein [Sphingobacteriia bacterium]|nr:MAG: septal ring lytic transglycosylase RlpA family protein [Sphingobacteriia bacterium]